MLEVRHHRVVSGVKKNNVSEKKRGGCWMQETRFRRSAHVNCNVKWIGTPFPPIVPTPCPNVRLLFNLEGTPFRYVAPEATSMT
jgi:hypothetical protein